MGHDKTCLPTFETFDQSGEKKTSLDIDFKKSWITSNFPDNLKSVLSDLSG